MVMKMKKMLDKAFPTMTYNIANYGEIIYKVNYESVMETSTGALFINVTFNRLEGTERYSVANKVLLEHYWRNISDYSRYFGTKSIHVSLGECEPTDCI
jgi:hypothetical protein